MENSINIKRPPVSNGVRAAPEIAATKCNKGNCRLTFDSSIPALFGTIIIMFQQLLGAEIVSLNHVWTVDSPLLQGVHETYSVSQSMTHNGTLGAFPGGISAATFQVNFSGQHGGPTVDALGHIGLNNVLFDGTPATDIDGVNGLLKYGIDEYPEDRYVNRGILVDIPYCKGNVDELLPQFYAISVDDITDCVAKEGIEIREGDSVLIRTGWGSLFATDPIAYVTNYTGVGGEAASYLAENKIFLTGTDVLAYDVANSPFPCHGILIAQSGIYIVESMNLEPLSKACLEKETWEFALVLNPPKFKGLAAMPTNVFAIFMPEAEDCPSSAMDTFGPSFISVVVALLSLCFFTMG